jgi:hypothetical protein
MDVWSSVKGDGGEVWGTGLCACSDKMVGNLGGGGYLHIQSTVNLLVFIFQSKFKSN